MEEIIEGGFEAPKYEDMTREELIESLEAHDAHHQEHHEKEAGLVKALEWIIAQPQHVWDECIRQEAIKALSEHRKRMEGK